MATLVALLAACAVPHTMKPRPVSHQCPPNDRSPVNRAITWIGPAQPHDSTALASWCRTVGPPVIDSVPRVAIPSDQGDSLLVITWNLKGGSADFERFMLEELGVTCAGGRSNAGPGFHHFVMAVQEAYRGSSAIPPFPEGAKPPLAIEEEPWSGRQDIVAAAARCGLALYYAPSMRNGATEIEGQREDKGNAIVSSLPLHDFLAIELPFETQRRVVVGATVRPPDGDSLRLLSLHLDVSPGLWRVMKTGNSSRLRQAMGIVDALAYVEQPPGGTPGQAAACEHACEAPDLNYPISTILAGDLNTWTDGQTVIRHLFDYFPDSPPTDGLPTRGEFPADHIFFRQQTAWDGPEAQLAPGSYRRLSKKYRSDHRARMLILQLGSH